MIGPTLEEVLDQVVTSRLQSVYTSLPGRVLAFNPFSSTCTVQPFPAIYQDGEAVDLPVLHGVPVGFPSGGGASITYPLESGDVVMLVFASAPLGRYREDGAEGDPSDVRRFDLSDAWALPLAGGSQPSATTGRLVVTQPTLGKVQVGDGLLTPAAARVGDQITITMNSVNVNLLITAMAQIAATGTCVPFPLTGTITTGSNIVEVA
jgi:hypothetical protein